MILRLQQALLVILFSPLTLLVQAQTNVIIDGANPVVLSNTNINIIGTIILQNSATVDNSGKIILSNDLINNAGNTGFVNQSPGTVELSGDTQNITGAFTTEFYHLKLAGTGTKILGNDIRVLDTLDLKDRELSTDIYTAKVMSTNTGIISRTSGFVSSNPTGGLQREMNTTAAYVFPVGTSFLYRPAEVAPTTSNPQSFVIRMAGNDPTPDSYNTGTKALNVGWVNNKYYYYITHAAGTDPADISLSYDNAVDSSFTNIVNWANNTSGWSNTANPSVIANSSPALSYVKSAGVNNFANPEFDLSTTGNSLPNSIAALDATSGILLYPNPASTGINLMILSEETGYEVSVYNMVGEKMWNKEAIASNSAERIEVQQWPAGNYIIRIIKGESAFYRKFVVIK